MPPRMNMIIQHTSLPRIPFQQLPASQARSVSLKPMAFNSPMISRIANARPSCGACGKH